MEYRDELKAGIEHTHGCKALHIATTPVKEIFQGRVAWEGEVETFALTGHAKAKKAHAWGYLGGAGKLEIVTVLELPPVDSPQTAVKVAIAGAAKASRN